MPAGGLQVQRRGAQVDAGGVGARRDQRVQRVVALADEDDAVDRAQPRVGQQRPRRAAVVGPKPRLEGELAVQLGVVDPERDVPGVLQVRGLERRVAVVDDARDAERAGIAAADPVADAVDDVEGVVAAGRDLLAQPPPVPQPRRRGHRVGVRALRFGQALERRRAGAAPHGALSDDALAVARDEIAGIGVGDVATAAARDAAAARATSVDRVVAGAGVDLRQPHPAQADRVLARAAGDRAVADAALEEVVARAAGDDLQRGAPVDGVVARARVEDVARRRRHAGLAQAPQHVVAVAAAQGVGPRAAEQRVVARRSRVLAAGVGREVRDALVGVGQRVGEADQLAVGGVGREIPRPA